MADSHDIPLDQLAALCAALDGRLTDAERVSLAQLLRTPQGRRLYVGLMRLEPLLEQELTAGTEVELDPLLSGVGAETQGLGSCAYSTLDDLLSSAMILPALRSPEQEMTSFPRLAAASTPRLARRSWTRNPAPHWRWAAMIVLLLLGSLLTFALLRTSRGPAATLAGANTAEWDGAAPAPGQALPLSEHLRLKSGLAELAFASGSHVILEGPCDFVVITRNSGQLYKGRMTAHVPAPARGFSVRCDQLLVTDQGTEFGLCAAESGMAEVHVLAGVVNVDLPDGPRRREPLRLIKDDAVRCPVAGGSLERMPAAPQSFVRSLAAPAGSLPRPVADYSLDDSAADRVDDSGAGAPADGKAVGGVMRVQGHDGGGARQFDGESGLVDLGNPPKLNIEGRITLAAWIRVEDASGYRNIIEHGYSAEPKRGVYLRLWNGRFEAGSWNDIPAGGEKGTGAACDHRAFAPMDASDQSTWIHLTGVYDGTAWRLYRNGVLLASNPDPVGAVTVPAAWCIGAGAGLQRRFFRGCIDDVKIFNRALTPSEVAMLAHERRSE